MLPTSNKFTLKDQSIVFNFGLCNDNYCGKKRVVLGLAICLVLSSFHEVGGNDDSNLFDDPELPVISIRSVITAVEEQSESENKSDREGESSVETSSAMPSKKTSSSMFRSIESVTTLGGSSDFNNLIQYEAVRGHAGARRGSHTISIIRSTRDMGKIGPDYIDRMIERDMEDARRIQDEIERVMEAASMGSAQQHESTKGNGAQGLWELEDLDSHVYLSIQL